MRWNKPIETMFSLEEVVQAITQERIVRALKEDFTLNTILLKLADTPFNFAFDVSRFIDNGTIDPIADEIFRYYYERFFEHGVVVIPTAQEYIDILDLNAQKAIIKYWRKFFMKLNLTWDYYSTLMREYANAKNELMSDIKALSTSKNYFNDTPQTPNENDVYEGDNYISTFTKNVGETSSPLTSKIMRLKELQEHYKMILEDWLNNLEDTTFEEEVN